MSEPENKQSLQDELLAPNTEAKNYAIIAYITIFGLIIALILNSEKQHEFTRYHIRQSLGLSVTLFVLGLVNIVPILGQLLFMLGSLAGLFLWFTGLLNAVNARMRPLPIVGEYYQQILKNL